MPKLYANIILSLKNAQTDRIFDYAVPEALQDGFLPGLRVLVPFGPRNTRTEGYVMSVAKETMLPPGRLKSVLEVLDDGKPMFTPALLALASWMKHRCFCTLSQCLQAMMPSGIQTKTIWMVHQNGAVIEGLTSVETKAMLFLQEKGGTVPASDFEELFGKKHWEVLRPLKEKHLIRLSQQVKKREYVKGIRLFSLNMDLPEVLIAIQKDKRLSAQRKVVEYLLDGKEYTLAELTKAIGISDATLRTLRKKGLLRERFLQTRRDTIPENVAKTDPFIPTPMQRAALEALTEELECQTRRPVLLHGITGSGKTEIYMQMIAKVLERGQQAIVLVPEISLTPQMVVRFVSRFGAAVSVTHSRLNAGERFDQWKKARDHEISVMIGPRSALFTPFDRLGIVIIDEEHEGSYRSDLTPKYDAREAAEELCKQTGALLLLGSATPDICTYHKTVTGDYRLIELKERTGQSVLPSVTITDMRKELAEGNRSMFGMDLHAAIGETLRKKEQTILFLNRRGFSTFVSCRRCGQVLTCDSCSISYTYHAKENELVCHYCGRRIAPPTTCPACGSSYIRYFGTGTQKIEEQTRRLFPEARILRMDQDTTQEKHSHERILAQFAEGKADILIGTQMIAKGHDFPKVTLVGILAADLSLGVGGYHASEMTFQLLTQAAGRAGRNTLPGRVFLQTYQPDHYSITRAAAQDYAGFFAQEIQLRRAMGYPPFSHILVVLCTSISNPSAMQVAKALAIRLRENRQAEDFTILGPAPSGIAKIKKEFRWRVIVKHRDREALQEFVLPVIAELQKGQKDVSIQLTMNPGNDA